MLGAALFGGRLFRGVLGDKTMSIRNNRMTPEDLRNSIDPAWPVDIRFLIGSAADSWEESLNVERQKTAEVAGTMKAMTDKVMTLSNEIAESQEMTNYLLIEIIKTLSRKMSAGLFSRLFAFGWRSMITEIEKSCKKVEEGFKYICPKTAKYEYEKYIKQFKADEEGIPPTKA